MKYSPVDPRSTKVFDILIEDGDWRITRCWDTAARRDQGPRIGRWVIIQHRCDPEFYEEMPFSDDPWSLCYKHDRVCSMCDKPVLPKMVGFHDLIMWNNDVDNI